MQQRRTIGRYYCAREQNMCGIPKLFVYLVFAAVCHPASAQRLQFSDCSAHALSVLKHRIYAPDKKLRPIILSRDVLHLSICNGIGAGMRVGAIEDVRSEERRVG